MPTVSSASPSDAAAPETPSRAVVASGSARDRPHHFTVDVEEYFQVSAMEPFVSRSQWDSLESRVVGSTERLLELMEEKGARGTFFVLGWIAKRYPGLVRSIAREGHEVASHGWGHERVTQQTPGRFRECVRSSKEVLEQISGQAVLGYRAPSFSIVPGHEWALDVLLEEGYRYDSSLFPVQRAGYGYAAGRREPYWIDRPAGRLFEVPPATLRRFGRNLPAGGGAYFRLFPYRFVESAFHEAERRGVPGTFYIHPWEWDEGQPVLGVSRLTRIRHYGGIRRTWSRLHRLLGSFRFTGIDETYRSASG
jgi:polysaccharide deacetylase family protein (PEP-CTERM system associated)